MTGAAVSLAYGTSRVDVRLGTGRFTALAAPPFAPLVDIPAALRACLAAPIASPPLADCVRPRDRVTIVVADATRATGADRLLPTM